MIRELFLAKPISRLITEQIILLVLCIGMILGIGYGRAYTTQQRNGFQGTLARIELLPTTVSHQADVQQTVLDRQHDYERVFELLKTPDTINEVVSTVEQVAAEHDVTVSIPRIFEAEPPRGSKGAPKPAEVGVVTGKHAGTVSLELALEGPPADLLRFVHSLEYAPFLGHVASWELKAVGVGGRGPSTIVGNALVPGGAPGVTDLTPSVPRGNLSLKLNVTVYKMQADEAE